MAHNPILVRNISYLTDARYFAAMEVDWISMELSEDPLSFSRWHALLDWIAGVKLAAEPLSNDESLIAKIIIDAKPDGIVTNNPDLIYLTGGLRFFYLTDQIVKHETIQMFTYIISYRPDETSLSEILQFPPEQIYLEAEWTVDHLKLLLDSGYKGGICFSGCPEDLVGVKDYGRMDEMIGLIG